MTQKKNAQTLLSQEMAMSYAELGCINLLTFCKEDTKVDGHLSSKSLVHPALSKNVQSHSLQIK